MKSTQSKSEGSFSIRDVAVLGMMTAMLIAGKKALEFLPNVEIVTLLLIIFTLHYGKKTIAAAVAFTMLEIFFWGLQIWVIMYLYIWPALVIITDLTKKHAGRQFYCCLSAIFGLFFGAACSIPYLFIGGPSMAFAWWIAGIPYDVVHCIGNFLLCLVLYKPLDYAAGRAIPAALGRNYD